MTHALMYLLENISHIACSLFYRALLCLFRRLDGIKQPFWVPLGGFGCAKRDYKRPRRSGLF